MISKLTQSSIFKNSAMHSVSLGVGMMLILGFIPLLFMSFTPEEVGIYFFLNTLSFAWIFVDLGIPQAIINICAKLNPQEIEKRSRYLISGIIFILIACFLVTSIVYFSSTLLINFLNLEHSADVVKSGILSISILHSTSVLNLAISAYHKSLQNFKPQVLINILTPIRLYFIIGASFFMEAQIVDAILISGIFSLGFTFIILIYTLETKLYYQSVRLEYQRELLELSKHYMVTNLNVSLTTVLIRYFTLSFAGLETFGVFSAVHSIYSKVVQLCEALGEVLFSAVSKNSTISFNKILLTRVIIANLIIGCTVTCLGIFIVSWYNSLDLITIVFLAAVPFGVVQSPIKHYLNASSKSYINSRIYFALNIFIFSTLYIAVFSGNLSMTVVCFTFILAQVVTTIFLAFNVRGVR